MKKRKGKYEFSKILLLVDYIFMIVLIFLTLIFSGIDFITLDVAWIAQLGVSTGFYYWKTKSDNRVKVPIAVIKSLPYEMRSEIDLTEIIVSIINQSN